MDEQRLLEHERRQIEQIRELDMEELQIEEVEASSEDDDSIPSRGDGGATPYVGFTFDTCLASLHTYLGEVDDTHGRVSLLDGGAVLNLPMFYLEGIVLFPEATLPLRVLQPRFKAAVERALNQVDAPYTIGVVKVHRSPDDGTLCFATTGTTAEIRQYRRLEDGSFNVVTQGQQRFRLRRRWIDVEGAPCAEVQIVQEDSPLRTPKAAFAELASVSNLHIRGLPHATPSGVSHSQRQGSEDVENEWECMSSTSVTSDNSTVDVRRATDSPRECDRFYLSSSDEEVAHGLGHGSQRYGSKSTSGGPGRALNHEESPPGKRPKEGEKYLRRSIDVSSRMHRAPLSFWPHWVYQMYDSYTLARRAADLWRRIIKTPSMDHFIRMPDLLSFYIASKLPMSESTRQELLEINGVTYRLQREIQLLENFDLIRCKSCQSVIAKRSDMLVMSSDGPLNAYVNPYGCVHEVITVYNASGLALKGHSVEEHSWFPGYAWTITNCAGCEIHMGWMFTATKKNLLPKSFWGIRSSQVAEGSST